MNPSDDITMCMVPFIACTDQPKRVDGRAGVLSCLVVGADQSSVRSRQSSGNSTTSSILRR